jgi:hypothetical protein
MALEPPPEYVAFVERHLDQLRDDAAKVVGTEKDADLLYPLVLTDVASRWKWLERQRTVLRNSRAADTYLNRAFARQSERWQPDQPDVIDIQVWADELIRLPMFTTNAVRIASLGPEPPPRRAAPVCEASIAWIHAYEDRRRRMFVMLTILAVVLFGVLDSITP